MEKIQFYEDPEKEKIRPELLDKEALKIAKEFIEPPSERKDRRKGLSSSQLRRFYHDMKALKSRIRDEEDFARILPMLRLMKANASYACPKRGGNKKIPVEFKEFVHNLIDSIEDIKDFQAALLHFEAVVGYFYGEGGKQ